MDDIKGGVECLLLKSLADAPSPTFQQPHRRIALEQIETRPRRLSALAVEPAVVVEMANPPSLSTGGEIGILVALTGLGFCASNGEAKRKIGEGAVKLDDAVVSDPQLLVTVAGEPVKLSLGKKSHGLLVG